MDEIVDILRARIMELTALSDERRAAGASTEELEAYRLDVVQLQWELARLLISPAFRASSVPPSKPAVGRRRADPPQRPRFD